MSPLEQFREATSDAQAILEIGTLRSQPDRPTHHRDWWPDCPRYVRVDIAGGDDVDIVADAHELGAVFGACTFDAVISCSTWEHLERPWVAARSVAEVIRPGAHVFVKTHQTFPVHAYPHDYWRFSTDALRLIWSDAGLVTDLAEYEHACRIVPPANLTPPEFPWNERAEAWLNVTWTGHLPP